jgi:hypothetical protein
MIEINLTNFITIGVSSLFFTALFEIAKRKMMPPVTQDTPK